MSKKYINTLEFYNYGETNRMMPALGPSYKVKVSDKDGNIITIEKDDSLYACVKLAFDKDSGLLSLLDAAHGDAVLAEIEMPNADYIYNCRFDEASEKILFDVKSLYGNETDTIELDVQSLVELYEAGQGIEIGEKNEETGRKPISVKLAEDDGLLTLTDEGLGIDEKVVTEDELESAISGKADTEYVDELFLEISGSTGLIEELSGDVENIMAILGTDVDDPSIDERIDEKADLDEFNDLEDEVGEIEATLNEVSGKVDTLDGRINELSGTVEAIEEEIEGVNDAIEAISGVVDTLSNDLEEEVADRKANTVAKAEYDSSAKTINFINANDEVIDSIDATDFIKDGMVDEVKIENGNLTIVFNTDAGKETIEIPLTEIFNPDNYYTKDEIDEKVTALQETDAALINVDTQQWAVINQNRVDMETVDGQLWNAINNLSASATSLEAKIDSEIERATAAEQEFFGKVEAEEARAIARENEIEAEIDGKVAAETLRATGEEARLRQDLNAEIARATAAEQEFFGKVEEEQARAEAAEQEIAQDLHDGLEAVNGAIAGFNTSLQEETQQRIADDAAINEAIGDIRDTYATKDYVDTHDAAVKEEAKSEAIASAKTYTDGEIDTLETELKQYCDDGHTDLQNAISENSTKIADISNLRGVVGDDTSGYDDSGNGILDVLHREFHQLTNGFSAAELSGLLLDMLNRIKALENQ